MGVQFLKTSAGEDRLRKLIQRRLDNPEEREIIDSQIWDLFGEEWTVMFTDLSGFSRNVAEFGIIHFLVTIHEAERVLTPIIEDHGGFILKQEGDSFLILYRKPQRALACAIAMQKVLESYNADKAPTDKVLLCLGLGHGKLLKIGEADVFGAEVNAASKLGEDTAGPGEILATDSFRKALGSEDTGTWSALADAPPGSSGAWKLDY